MRRRPTPDSALATSRPIAPATAASVLVIAGPTASGKSALALELADAFGGTIINADSLQVYRDLRILTARPDEAAESGRRTGSTAFSTPPSAARPRGWRALALAEIAAATRSGRLPILVGGTGLYLRALEEWPCACPAKSPRRIRQEALELHRALGGAAFRERLARLDPAGAERLFPGDRQRLVRAFEVVRATGMPLSATGNADRRPPLPYRFARSCCMPPRDTLYAACDARFVG